MVKQVPTLTTTGWQTDIAKRADFLMAYYITSEFSQSEIYHGKVTSLPYHIQQHGSEPEKLKSRVENDLKIYFERYFNSVDIEVTTNIPSPDEPNKVNLQISAIVYEGDKVYSIGREIMSVNGKVAKIITLNNG